MCAQLSYTTEQRTVLIIFSDILQTISIAQMMSTGGEGELCSCILKNAQTNSRKQLFYFNMTYPTTQRVNRRHDDYT